MGLLAPLSSVKDRRNLHHHVTSRPQGLCVGGQLSLSLFQRCPITARKVISEATDLKLDELRFSKIFLIYVPHPSLLKDSPSFLIPSQKALHLQILRREEK